MKKYIYFGIADNVYCNPKTSSHPDSHVNLTLEMGVKITASAQVCVYMTVNQQFGKV